MTIASSPFVGIAVPLEFSPISKAYWQSNAAVKDIALRFSLKSNKATTKRAGKAKLLGVCCKHCKQELIVSSREHAISEIKTIGSYRGIQCTPCYRKVRDKKTMEMLRGGPTSSVEVRRDHPVKFSKTAQKLSFSKKTKHNPKTPSSTSKEDFYKSWEWRTLRMEAIKQHGRSCQCCGASPGMVDAAGQPVRICVDHIKPISKHWNLRLQLTNLQILCDECNQGKGNWDETDYRPSAPDEWVVEDDAISPTLRHQLSVHGETIQ